MRRTRNYDLEGGEEAHGVGQGSSTPLPFAPPNATSSSSSSSKTTTTATESVPCRTCTDFRSWMKLQKNAHRKDGDGPQKEAPPPPPSLTEEQAYRMDRELRACPADSVELGSATWKLLHTMSVNFPERPTESERRDMEQFVSLFGRLYPCRPCAEDFVEDVRRHPVDTASGPRFARWLCGAHNRVNEKLGKEQFDCSKVYERWRDGWKDGSCDY